MLQDSPRVGMEIEERIRYLKELIPRIPIRKTFQLQKELAELEKQLKEKNDRIPDRGKDERAS
jgi:hypothetical protein